MLRKLGELKQYGVSLSQNYNLNSDLDAMEYEYTLHSDIRAKQNGVNWMSHMLIGIIKGTEMLNDSYNPFEIKLSGLSDKIGNDIQNYYDVLGEIYEKYNQPGKRMAPELRLLLMVSGAGLSLQMNKVVPKVASQMMPGVSGLFKNNNNNSLDKLRQQAAENSDTNRNALQEKMNMEHQVASQKISDIEMLKQKEMEYQHITQQSNNVNATDNLKEGLLLSSESPNTSQYNHEINKLQQENSQKLEYVHKLQMNEHKQNEKKKLLQNEKKKLEDLINNIENENMNNIINYKKNNGESSIHTDSSDKSSKSTVYINPNMKNIINKSTKKPIKKNNDNVSFEDITIGSNNSGKNKNTTTINLGSNK